MDGTQRVYRLLITMLLAMGLMAGAIAWAQAAPLAGDGAGAAAQADSVVTPPGATETIPATLPATEPVSTETATIPAETPTVTEPTSTEPPATEPAGTTPATEPTQATEPVTPPPTEPVTSTLVIGKVFCQSIDESGTAENPCVGRVEAAEGTSVDFVVRPVGTTEDHPFSVPIGVHQGMTIGAIQITGVPLGTYDVCEVVPDGYTALPAPMDGSQQVSGAACLRITVGADGATAVFFNVPVTVPPSVVPTQVPPLPTQIATFEVPETHLASPTSVPFATPAAVTLPATGAGSNGAGDGSMWWLAMSAATLLGLAALTAKRQRRR